MKTYKEPRHQHFTIEGVEHMAPKDAHAALAAGEAVMIDLREDNEVFFGKMEVDNILYHPMSKILERLEKISKDQKIIVASPNGIRSAKIVNLFKVQGYAEVANLDGGITQWRQDALPYIMKRDAHFGDISSDQQESKASSCGCGCGSSPLDGIEIKCC